LLTAILHTSSPFAIRYPRDNVPAGFDATREPEAIPIGRWEELAEGREIVLIGCGTTVKECRKAAGLLAAGGVQAGLVNGRWVKPVDAEMIVRLAARYPRVLTVEENVLAGGFGDAVYECYQSRGLETRHLKHMGLPDRFVDHGSRAELLDEVGL